MRVHCGVCASTVVCCRRDWRIDPKDLVIEERVAVGAEGAVYR